MKTFIIGTIQGQRIIPAANAKAAVAKLDTDDVPQHIRELDTKQYQLCPKKCTMSVYDITSNYCPDCGAKFKTTQTKE